MTSIEEHWERKIDIDKNKEQESEIDKRRRETNWEKNKRKITKTDTESKTEKHTDIEREKRRQTDRRERERPWQREGKRDRQRKAEKGLSQSDQFPQQERRSSLLDPSKLSTQPLYERPFTTFHPFPPTPNPSPPPLKMHSAPFIIPLLFYGRFARVMPFLALFTTAWFERATGGGGSVRLGGG